MGTRLWGEDGKEPEKEGVPEGKATRNEKHVVHLVEELNRGPSMLDNQRAKEEDTQRELVAWRLSQVASEP